MAASDTTTRALPTLHEFFAPGGILARSSLPYEYRPGQLEMAKAVERALAERRHLIVEAGTGTGKTLAYLLPALRTGQRVIVSTGTKALQDQLYFRDIPFLETLLGDAARLLHEGPRQLPLPPQAGRAAHSADFVGTRRDRPVPADRRVGADHGNRRPLRAIRHARVERAVEQAGCADRGLPGLDLPGLSPLLYHRDAAQGARVGHHHRQPPPVFCRPEREARGRGRARCGHSARGRGGDLRRGA